MTKRYDDQARRQSKRGGRERGCWVYIAQAELERAGWKPTEAPPLYRARAFRRGTVLVNLFRSQ